MFQTISNFMRVGEIRRKIIFTLLMLIVFRIGTFIPVPSINADILASQDKLSVFGILNTFGGGALRKFSIFAMGIMPYITASIIIQLLQMDVVPKLTEWSKQGEAGRRKTAQLTRYLTVVLGFIEALGMSYGFNNLASGQLIVNPGIGTYLLIAVVLTAGTSFLMWLGEQITEKGVGNGISIIIFAGIVANIPTTVNQYIAQQFTNVGNALFIRIVTVVIIALVIIAIFVGVIFIQQANRKIPIQYAKRMTAGRTPVGGQSTHMPLKVNAAGVIPVIFAISFIITPRTIAQFFPTNSVTTWIINVFDYSKPIGMIMYAALIIAFTYFYAFIQVNPEQAAENLQKQSGYIPGIRPGKSTQEYLTRVLYRLTFVGSIFLAIIAVLPMLFIQFANLPQTAQIGGTSLLIVVGVALDTYKQLEAQLVKRHYKGFIK
ncbi:preprotein translocase subunit SecY [Bacillus sp. BRMEA1]|uniref:preprotein translocase subunit SecY n=1 Tax=Neobacillus endophyticus TaxID=2738405 RepID=UPI001566702B|nr:preprotein translocase subunit SecY [Neobacillus endophyticus]NRD77549.1 preprotein translocase subunit SecY [Neobacillus endophyticus]